MLLMISILLVSGYSLKAACLNETGSVSSSNSYKVWCAGGQSSVIGSGSSPSYLSNYGILACLSCRKSAVEGIQNEVSMTELYGVIPNPSRCPVNIYYTIAEKSSVSLKIYDLTGRLVKVLQNGRIKAGDYRLNWDGTDKNGNPLPAGVYFYRLALNGKPTSTKKLILVR